MARHAKTRDFTAEFYRVITSADPRDGNAVRRRQRVTSTLAHASALAGSLLDTTYSREPSNIDKGNVIVLDVLALADNEPGADPAGLACVTMHSVEPGAVLGKPSLTMPQMSPVGYDIARQVTYTQPQAVRFIRKTGKSLYSGGTVRLDDLLNRAVEVRPAAPADIAGYNVVAYDSPRWDDAVYTPGTDLDFDAAWSGNPAIASACRMTFEV